MFSKFAALVATISLSVVAVAGSRSYYCMPDRFPLPQTSQKSLRGPIQDGFGFRESYDSSKAKETKYPSIYPWGILLSFAEDKTVTVSPISVQASGQGGDVLMKKAPVQGPEFSFSTIKATPGCQLMTPSGKLVPLNIYENVETCYPNVASMGNDKVTVLLHPFFVRGDALYDRTPFAAGIIFHWMRDTDEMDQGGKDRLYENFTEGLACISAEWPNVPGADDKPPHGTF